MNIDAYVASDRGRRREMNEDAHLIDESLGLYIVCDGMGGHAAGDVASRKSVEFAADFIRQRQDILASASESPDGYYRVMELAEDATQEASRRLYDLACTETGLAGMGSTLTLLLVVNNKAVMAHVGDSRLYILRDGELHQLSNDHTLATELLQAGRLTPEEAAESQYNHVLTRSVGRQELVQVESLLFDLFPGDTFLICSDGLSNYFQESDRVIAFLQHEDLSRIPERLVDFANEAGGSDNITALTLRCSADYIDDQPATVQSQLDVLKTSFLCQNFPANRLMRVHDIARVVECDAGQEVSLVKKNSVGMFIVLNGCLSFESDGDTSNVVRPGDTAGETLLLSGHVDSERLVAIEPSTMLFLESKKFRRLVRRLPKLGNALLTNLCRHLSQPPTPPS